VLTVGDVSVELSFYLRPGGDLVIAVNRDGSAIARILCGDATSATLDVREAAARRADVHVDCATGKVIA
jgi:hypothetical protein